MNSYTVKTGDSLFTLAQTLLGDGNRYRDFMQWNPSITDPNKISVGQVIQYPTSIATTSGTSGVTVVATPLGDKVKKAMGLITEKPFIAVSILGCIVLIAALTMPAKKKI